LNAIRPGDRRKATDMKRLLAIAPVLGVLFAGCASKPNVDLTPAKEVLLSRYLGSWHEIAFQMRRFAQDSMARLI
jgi:lipocalin